LFNWGGGGVKEENELPFLSEGADESVDSTKDSLKGSQDETQKRRAHALCTASGKGPDREIMAHNDARRSQATSTSEKREKRIQREGDIQKKSPAPQ